jgi:hypothetical protein
VRYGREYAFQDHLGNLRLAYRAGHGQAFTATLEQDECTHTREVHQVDSLSVSPPVAQPVAVAHNGGYVAKLNAEGTGRQPLGPLKQLAVQKGNTVTIVAPRYYPQAVQNNSFAFSLAALVQQQPSARPPHGGLWAARGIAAAQHRGQRPAGGVNPHRRNSRLGRSLA